MGSDVKKNSVVDAEKDVDAKKDNGKDKKEEEKKPEYPDSVSLGKLFSYADKWDILLMVLGTIGAIGNGAAQPISFIIFGKVLEKFIDFGASQSNVTTKTLTMDDIVKGIDLEGQMRTFAIYYVIIAAGMMICGTLQAGCWSITAARQIHKIRQKFYSSILKQDIGWFDANEAGGLLSRLTDDIIKIRSGVGDKIGLIIFSIALSLGGFIVGFVYSWKLTLVILATTPALAIVGGLFGKVMADLSSEEQTAYSEAASVATEVISSIKTVVAFNGEYEEIDRYNSKLSLAEKAGMKKAFALGGSMGALYLVMFASYAVGFWYGAQLVAEGDLAGGDLLIVFFSVMFGGFQIGTVAPNIEALATARGAAYFVFSVCDKEPVINCLSEEGIVLSECKGDVTIENVDFNYPSRSEIPILKKFSLNIKNGSTVALVGESGCGKSTIVKLIQRFYDPQSGDIKIDGHSLKEVNLKWLRSNIGVVSQEPVLFEMSIGENIQLGELSHVSQADIETAAKNANAHDFIMQLPQKYNTYVGEGGAQLSGGQKQRIAIARALVRDPKILLLDEATSALDTESEGIVQAALDKASEGRTTVIIAHRLSTIINADMIVAVKKGEVVETGTHKELMEKKGFYHNLVLFQSVSDELGENENPEEVKTKIMRTLSTLSGSSSIDEDDDIANKITRQFSISKSRPSIRKKSIKEEKKNDDDKEEKEDITPASYFRILSYNISEWPYFVVGSFGSAIIGAFPLVFAVILAELLSEFSFLLTIKEKSKKYALYFFITGVILGIAYIVSSLAFGKAGETLTRRLRKLTFQALLRQEIGFFDDPKNSSSRIGTRLASDASNVQSATAVRFNTMIQVIVMGLSSAIMAFYYSWKLTLVVLAFSPLLVLGGIAQIAVFGNFASKEGKLLITANALASESIMNVRTVATLGKETYFVREFSRLIMAPHKKTLKNCIISALAFGMSVSVMMLSNAAGFALGGKLVQDKEIEFSAMFKVIIATMMAAMTAGNVMAMVPDVMEGKISAARIFQLMDRIPAIDSFSTEGDTKPAEKVEGHISLSGVDFRYPTRPEVPVLDGLSLNITAGQKVALVGTSGCGKSTTIGLMERFYDPDQGYITLDQRNTKEFNVRWLRSILGLVSQEPVLFARSIKDNITFGLKKKPSEQDIVEAATKANIHSFISGLPQGYDTMVGEKGTLISGGQKQRIAIARAIVRDPKIMLLDEATSALDSESEKVVQQALDAAMIGRTSIIIAHRLSTIQNADMIVVIQNGQVVEKGTHQELIANQGPYYQLNKNQVF